MQVAFSIKSGDLKHIQAVVKAVELVPMRTTEEVVFEAFVVLVGGLPGPAELV